MKIFIDTGAWIALETSNDRWHAEAKKYFQQITRKRALLYTNDYVLTEVYTRLIYDIHLTAAQKFHGQIQSTLRENQLVLLEVGPIEREQAWLQLMKYSDHKLSFTDATIVANFHELHLDALFTFDRHFQDINLPTSLATK